MTNQNQKLTVGEEGLNVQEENSEINYNELRTLTQKERFLSKTYDELPEILSCRGLKEISPSHLEILKSIYRIQTFLFSGISISPEYPSWIMLLRSPSPGLRKVSTTWAESADNYFKPLIKESKFTSLLVADFTTDPYLAYSLSKFDIAISKSGILSERERSLIDLRMKTKSSENILEHFRNILECTFDNTDKANLLANMLIISVRNREQIAITIFDKLQDLFFSRRSNFDATSACNVINAMNFKLIKDGLFEQAEKNISCLENEVFPDIENTDLLGQLKGNAFYHRGIIKQFQFENEQALANFEAALSFDHGFEDYYYRVAQILHDRKDIGAQKFYESALSVGPLNFSIANDYGVFLDEFLMTEKLQSWSQVVNFFFEVE